MYKLDEVMIDRLENKDFTVKKYDFEIDFGKYTSAGQDFHIYAMHCRNLSDVIEDLKQQYNDYDPSYETSLWLDETGHGKNGAPYDMIDIYNDMLECESIIEELINSQRYKIAI